MGRKHFLAGCLTLLLLCPFFALAVRSNAAAAGQAQHAEIKAFLYADGGYFQPLTIGFTSSFDANGYGRFGWEFNNPSATALQNARLVVFLDADLDRETTTFFNEHGALVNLNLPPEAAPGDVAPSGWEIDEPGFLFGDIAQHLATGVLDQLNNVPASAPDDVALALRFQLGPLPAGAPVNVRCFISQTDIGGLRQTDRDTNTTLYFNGYAQTNQPPAITPSTVARQQGSPGSVSTIATVSDDITPAGALAVAVTTPAPGIVVANLTNNNGTITANVAAACNAPLGANTVGLTVTDGGGLTATASLIVNVTANTLPTLGNYPPAGVINLGAGTTVAPSSPPTDNGSITSIVASAPSFTSSFSVNPATGAVTISNAAPPGNHTVTVTATDNCGAITTKTFNLTVNGPPNIVPQTITRQQGVPASVSTIAVVTDDLTPAGNLAVAVASIPAGITITGVANTNGSITASVAAACNATLGDNTVALTVTDGGGLSKTANLTVSVTANPPPALGNYPATGVNAGANVTVAPSAAPTDNGAITTMTASVAPGSFTGTVSVNPDSGVVTITNAAPAGSYTATVTATDNCGAVSTRAFALTVNSVTPAITGSVGSILFFNTYTSNAATPNTENTRVALTNTDPARKAIVHLFFVDGATCAAADAFICLTPNQTTSFLASDLDPGTTGYIVAVAIDDQGCPANFNHLIGDEYVKFASGHAANLAAESFQAIAGGLPKCDEASTTAAINFDGVSYSRAPRALAADNIPDRASGNDTLLIINRVGGNLGASAQTLGAIFGILYNDAEQGFSFSFNPGACQFRSILSNNFPRTTPRLEQIIPAGRSGWMKLWSSNDAGLLGAMINSNANAGANAGAFNQGHNLHKLTLTTSASFTIPVITPSC